MLSLHGYEVDNRNVGRPEHLSELRALGFESIPVVVVDGRGFPGFPEEVLLRELGLPPPAGGPLDDRRRLDLVGQVVETAVRLVAQLPETRWSELVTPDRDRALGQWTWHVFRYVENVLEAAEEGELPWRKIEPLVERRTWTRSGDFQSFSAVSAYGGQVAERLRIWSSALPESGLSLEVRAYWGPSTMRTLVDNTIRHTSIHLRQLRLKLQEWRPDAPEVVSAELLAAMPDSPAMW